MVCRGKTRTRAGRERAVTRAVDAEVAENRENKGSVRYYVQNRSTLGYVEVQCERGRSGVSPIKTVTDTQELNLLTSYSIL